MVFGHSLELLIHIHIGLSGCDTLGRNIYTVPGQAKQFAHSKGTGKSKIDRDSEPLILAHLKGVEESGRIPDVTLLGF